MVAGYIAVVLQKLRVLSQPTKEWGPAVEAHKTLNVTHDTNIPLNSSNLLIHDKSTDGAAPAAARILLENEVC